MRILLIVLLLISTSSLFAQDHKWELGFALNNDKTFFRFKGLNFSPINEQRLIAFNKDTDSAKIALNPSTHLRWLPIRKRVIKKPLCTLPKVLLA